MCLTGHLSVQHRPSCGLETINQSVEQQTILIKCWKSLCHPNLNYFVFHCLVYLNRLPCCHIHTCTISSTFFECSDVSKLGVHFPACSESAVLTCVCTFSDVLFMYTSPHMHTHLGVAKGFDIQLLTFWFASHLYYYHNHLFTLVTCTGLHLNNWTVCQQTCFSNEYVVVVHDKHVMPHNRTKWSISELLYHAIGFCQYLQPGIVAVRLVFCCFITKTSSLAFCMHSRLP